MVKAKKGLFNKTIVVFDTDTDEKFEIYVTYGWFNDNELPDDIEPEYTDKKSIDLKHFESNSYEEIPLWVTEDLVYNTLIDEIEEELDDVENEEIVDILDDDFSDDDEFDENW